MLSTTAQCDPVSVDTKGVADHQKQAASDRGDVCAKRMITWNYAMPYYCRLGHLFGSADHALWM